MTPGQDQLFALILSSLAVVFIPLLILMVRIITKWTKVEMRLDDLVVDMKQLIIDKDRTHTEMINQMADDRKATDRRLRWLEENVWNRIKP